MHKATGLGGLLLAAGILACDRAADGVRDALPGTWTISADAFGPLRVGMLADSAMAAAPGLFMLPAPSEAGGCTYASWPAGPAGVRLMFAGDTLVRIESDSAVATDGGARVGDSEARIDSLYGDRVRRQPHKYTDGRYLIVPSAGDSALRLVFETDGARVTRFRAGRLPQVEWVEGCS